MVSRFHALSPSPCHKKPIKHTPFTPRTSTSRTPTSDSTPPTLPTLPPTKKRGVFSRFHHTQSTPHPHALLTPHSLTPILSQPKKRDVHSPPRTFPVTHLHVQTKKLISPTPALHSHPWPYTLSQQKKRGITLPFSAAFPTTHTHQLQLSTPLAMHSQQKGIPPTPNPTHSKKNPPPTTTPSPNKKEGMPLQFSAVFPTPHAFSVPSLTSNPHALQTKRYPSPILRAFPSYRTLLIFSPSRPCPLAPHYHL